MKVGMVGLGTMGLPIARNFVAGGFDLAVFNRTPARAAALGDRVTLATSLDQLAGVDVLVTMVTGDDALEDIFFTQGLMEKLPDGCVHMSCSTISIAMVRRLQAAHTARSSTLVTAPVVGRADRAAAGTLAALVAGPSEAKSRIAPLLACTTARTFDLGIDPCAALAAKLANNFMIGVSIEMLAQAFSVTDAHGVERDAFLDFITTSLFAAPVIGIYGDLMRREQFVPAGSPLAIGLKDMGLAKAAAAEGMRELPFADIVESHLRSAMAQGLDDHDWAVLGRPDQQWPLTRAET